MKYLKNMDITKEVSQKINELRNTKSEKLYNKRLYGDERGNGKLAKKWHFLIEAFKISHKCCYFLKKSPSISFEKRYGLIPLDGLMVSDSVLRMTAYIKNKGCFTTGNRPKMSPISFWNTKNIYEYIDKYNLDISTIYSKGYKNTGCMFCAFGCHLEKPNKFQLMKYTHPKYYKYCMEVLELKKY